MPSVIRLFFLLSLIVGVASCGPTVVYEETKPTSEAGWPYADTLSFVFDVADTTQAYDLEVVVTHGTNFPYENFYLLIYTDLPTGRRTKQSVSLDLSGDFGAWNGDCSGERCELTIPILLNTRYQQAGRYGITLEQYSREETLPAIYAMGLRLLHHEVGG
ncbi:gliding motility lipoprotein GldH [Neolewinella antarctica]|uniref:Gliding motility-associated lipoprotein GldH n=1 Tax=Neolewinella antarctica TaxID=442734 RepID=A0ABX0X7K2_9BACT|nr:gliding motility lipoprotein GldH [Neolewinella antarctica]NJC25231.1 gliding motility-associated lipoprotein GldH [Neolewinella antarctica]